MKQPALRPLDLDFRASRRRAPWAAWLLLAVAVGFSADLGVSFHAARTAVAATEMKLARLERTRDGASPRGAARSVPPEEIALARDTYQRLTTPWNRLFTALEAVPAERVRLVAIEPNAKAGTVVISGEGADYPAVLEYVTGLQRARAFERVHLVRHEVRENDAQRKAAFAVSAAWSEAR